MTSRFRFVMLVGSLALVGCDDAQFAGPILYRPHERIAKDLAEKPKLQAAIQKSLTDLFGEDLQHIKIPEDSGLRDGGIYLANSTKKGDKIEPVLERDPVTKQNVPIAGGYALYRHHCLHCHGVFGAGDGPTSEALFPRPRDYRMGLYKFTSTNPVNAKPSRADLRKTILYGLDGTSMPMFAVNMSATEIEQVIDYMTFLSMRGETERYLIDEAMNNDDKDADSALSEDVIKGIVSNVTSSWKDAETQVVNPTVRRTEPPPRESIVRGRDFFLGTNPSGPKLECIKCHGASGRGDGETFIEKSIVEDVMFRRWPLDQAIGRAFKTTRDQAAAAAGSHPAPKVKADPEGVAKFLEENPAIVARLRKERNLMADLPEKAFAERSKSDPKIIAEAARVLLPELDDPEFRAFLVSKVDLWVKSLDDWGNPLRPANLLTGNYKGGRRPIDLYWRIAKGINGAKMPSHASLLTDDQIWDLVNFVLAVPDDPGLLPLSIPVPAKQPHTVASSP